MSSLAWRQRRNAVGKKLAPEVELLMDAEPLVHKAAHVESSPVSIASAFPEFPPEMQSFILPGAWTVVGKGGKPLKNSKTYDPPKARKKKKKSRARKADADDLHATLAEMPSSSKCLNKHERTASKREKKAECGRDARYWSKYRQAKQEKIFALDALTAALGDDGMLGDDIEPGMIERPLAVPKTLAQRQNKGDRHAEKVRRRARLASQAAKCYVPDTDDFDAEEAMIRTLQWEAAKASHESERATQSAHAEGKEGKAAPATGLRKWLPDMKQLKSIVQAVLEAEEAEAEPESIEHCADAKKRKDQNFHPARKTGKKSKVWREGRGGKGKGQGEGETVNGKRCLVM